MNNILQKGLTLTEMLVVVSIVILFSAFVFGNYSVGKDGLALERASQKLGQDLRRAQEMGMAASFATGYNGAGIYLNESSSGSYILYHNSNSDGNYYYQAGTDYLKETITIEAGVKICNLQDNGSDIGNNYVSVSFAPPEPITRIENNNSGHEVSIILCSIADNTKTRTIKVNNVGRIEVN